MLLTGRQPGNTTPVLTSRPFLCLSPGASAALPLPQVAHTSLSLLFSDVSGPFEWNLGQVVDHLRAKQMMGHLRECLN